MCVQLSPDDTFLFTQSVLAPRVLMLYLKRDFDWNICKKKLETLMWGSTNWAWQAGRMVHFSLSHFTAIIHHTARVLPSVWNEWWDMLIPSSVSLVLWLLGTDFDMSLWNDSAWTMLHTYNNNFKLPFLMRLKVSTYSPHFSKFLSHQSIFCASRGVITKESPWCFGTYLVLHLGFSSSVHLLNFALYLRINS